MGERELAVAPAGSRKTRGRVTIPFQLELARPWLLGAVLALGAVALGRTRRARKLVPRDLPRVLLVLAVALAAGEPRVRDPDPPRTRILVLDRSASFAPARAGARAALEAAGRDLEPARDRLAAIAFGARPVLASGLVPASEAASVARAAALASVDPAGSDLGAALELALETAREAGGAVEVILVSDGQDTGGRARAAAERLAAAGIVLHAVSPPASPPANARVARVELPPRAAVGEAVIVHVEVEATVRSPVAIALELEGAAALMSPAEVHASSEPGSPARVAFEVRAAAPGLVLARARARLLAAQDEFAPDDVVEASFVAGDAPRSILVAGASPEPWRSLLEEARFAVEVATPERLAAVALDPARGPPDLVVLDDVPASALGAEPTSALERLVEAGTGLVVAGCESAFGPGGYPGAPIEKLLPVRSGPPGDGKPLVLELVLDASGSMGAPVDARTRFLAAVDAAVPRARELRKGDLLGIVVFSETPRVVRELATVADEGRILFELKSIEPSGGTDVASGLARGLEELGSREGKRLLVLVTDGEDPGAKGKAARVAAAAEPLRKGADFEAALVFVGSDGRATLEALAGAIDPEGKHAHVHSVAEAGPELGKLVRGVVSERRNEERTGTFPVLGEHGERLGVIESFAPVQPKPLARAWLTVEDGDHAMPLAVGAPGRAGSVVAIATSLAGRGASLARTPAGRAALEAIARQAARPLAGTLELEARRVPGAVEVIARARDGAHVPSGLVASFASASGVSGEASLEPRAPGTWSARFPGAPDERLVVRAQAPDRGVLAASVVPSAASLELAPPLRDVALLAELAAITGDARGVAPELGVYARPEGRVAGARWALAPWLALAALGLLLAEGAVAVLVERAAVRRAAAREAARVA